MNSLSDSDLTIRAILNFCVRESDNVQNKFVTFHFVTFISNITAGAGGDFYFKNEFNCKRVVRWMCVCCSLVLKAFEGFVFSRSQASNLGNARVSVD